MSPNSYSPLVLHSSSWFITFNLNHTHSNTNCHWASSKETPTHPTDSQPNFLNHHPLNQCLPLAQTQVPNHTIIHTSIICKCFIFNWISWISFITTFNFGAISNSKDVHMRQSQGLTFSNHVCKLNKASSSFHSTIWSLHC